MEPAATKRDVRNLERRPPQGRVASHLRGAGWRRRRAHLCERDQSDPDSGERAALDKFAPIQNLSLRIRHRPEASGLVRQPSTGSLSLSNYLRRRNHARFALRPAADETACNPAASGFPTRPTGDYSVTEDSGLA